MLNHKINIYSKPWENASYNIPAIVELLVFLNKFIPQNNILEFSSQLFFHLNELMMKSRMTLSMANIFMLWFEKKLLPLQIHKDVFKDGLLYIQGIGRWGWDEFWKKRLLIDFTRESSLFPDFNNMRHRAIAVSNFHSSKPQQCLSYIISPISNDQDHILSNPIIGWSNPEVHSVAVYIL